MAETKRLYSETKPFTVYNLDTDAEYTYLVKDAREALFFHVALYHEYNKSEFDEMVVSGEYGFHLGECSVPLTPDRQIKLNF